jgi:hypothetical protein
LRFVQEDEPEQKARPGGSPGNQRGEHLMPRRRSETTGLDVLRRDFGVVVEPGFWVALLLNLAMAGAVGATIYLGLERLP